MEETKEKIKTVRECLIGEYNKGYFIRGKQTIFFDGTPRIEQCNVHFDIIACIFFPLFPIGYEGQISEVDISEIADEIVEGNKIVYAINDTFDAFGRLNILGNFPKKVSLMIGKKRIFEKKFEDEIILKKEPIILSVLRKEKLKLILEYEEAPKIFPHILCDIWTLSDGIKQHFQSIVYSEKYDFYYEG